MRPLFLFFYMPILLFGGQVAAGTEVLLSDISSPDHFNPIKVSEINANLFSKIYDFFQVLGADLLHALVSLKDFIVVGNWIFIRLEIPEVRDQVVFFILQVLVTLTITFFLAKVTSFWLRPKINSLLECRNFDFLKKLKNLFISSVLAVIPPLIFGFSFYVLSRLLNSHNDLYFAIAHIISSGATSIWILLSLARLFLHPLTPNQQHLPFSRLALNTTYTWVRRMAFVAFFGFLTLEISKLIKLPAAGEKFLLQITGLIIMVMAIAMTSILRREIKSWIQIQRRKNKLSPIKKAMLPYLNYSYAPVVVFICVSYVSWATHAYDSSLAIIWKGLFTLAIFPITRLLAFYIRKRRVLYACQYLRKRSHWLAPYIIPYGARIDSSVLIFLNICALLFVFHIWNFSPFSFLFSPFGKLLLERTLSILLVLGIALCILRAGNSLLTKYLSSPKLKYEGIDQQRLARFKTIFSVSRNVLRIIVWTPAVLLIAIELGINILPLITTVGIFSVGLSFGVQSLVKDFVTGFFMLLENTFAVGDLVLINGQLGRIESLTIRIVRLRSTDGSLHTFPYGNITSLCNQNRDFSAAVMLFQVGFNADIMKVFDIVEKIYKDLRKDPSVRPFVVGPMRIDGVNTVNDHALEIRAVIRTTPGDYEKIKWAFNRLLKQYLEEEKIPIATPREICYTYAVEK